MASEEKMQETSDQLIEEISNKHEVPTTYEPPSPLTGCYLLIILGEPHSLEHKDIILQRLLKGLLSWNVLNCHVDLEEELNSLTNHAPEGEAARHGERLIQFASENLVTEILIHPQYNTLIQCMRNLLSSFTRHRHIIHSGYTFSGNGSWILQDATFSVSDFAEALQDYEVQRVMRAYPDTISMEIHCATSGHWAKLPDKSYSKLCKIRINSVDILDSGSEKLNAFINYLSPLIAPASLGELMESSDVVGNIRFSHPTLYVFPGGQGDAALFGINGFNMLVDGGFNRKSCFWDFTRHLDRLDAVLMTRINNANIQGISSIIERKAISNVYPQIGYFFTNIPETKPEPSLESDKDSDPLLVNLFERGQSLTSNLKSINLKPQPCYKDIEPINLYHKVGHGTLDMYVISPSKESKEVREFLQKWNARDQNLFATKQSKEFQFPLQNLVSICAMLVWQPANPEETITRILFPGSTPDYKIIEGLDRMKHLEFVKHPVCTANQIEASISSSILTKKQLKSALADKSTHEPILPSKGTKTTVVAQQEKDNKMVTESTKVTTKVVSEKENVVDGEVKVYIEKDGKTAANDDKEPEKDNKTASETTKPVTVKSRIDSRPPKSMERKLKKDSSTEKKSSSSPITTPKKEPKSTKDKEVKPKVISRITKTSPSSTPAKSAKEANNRKVLESKQKITVKTAKKEQTIEKKEVKVERKAISRRPKPAAGSPMKAAKPKTSKDTAVRRPVKLDKGATSDSSIVSTASAADDAKSNKKTPEQEKQILLDDLMEEQEAVREIEAVLSRSEDRNKEISPNLRAIIDKQDSTTEADEDEEYIIIEKEEPYTEDSVNEQESAGKEEEIQKHQRDSQESEKKRKPSMETTEEEEPPQKAEQAATEDVPAVLDDVADEPADVKEEKEEEEIPTAHKMNGDIPKQKDVEPQPEAKSDEISPISGEKPASDDNKDEKVDLKETDIVNPPESQPFSATAESGATTAPTLPEDEQVEKAEKSLEQQNVTLDEIKEDVVIEEKYIKEETKETQVVVVTTTIDEPIERIQPKPIHFEGQTSHLRDHPHLRTPDEVADLPVHEEVDAEVEHTPAGSRKASLQKIDEPKKPEIKESVEIEKHDEKLDLQIEKEDKVEPEEEKIEAKSPTEKKTPSPTGRKSDDSLTKIEPKVSSPVEKVEYKVEELGQQFENTLKDVTGKVELPDASSELKGKSPVDDVKHEEVAASEITKPDSPKEEIQAKDEAIDRKSVSPIDDKHEEISATVIQTETSEIKTEIDSVNVEKIEQIIESERKDSVAKPSEIETEKIVSKSPSPDLKEEIIAPPKETADSVSVTDVKRTSLVAADIEDDVAKIDEQTPLEDTKEKSKTPSPIKEEEISELPKESVDATAVPSEKTVPEIPSLDTTEIDQKHEPSEDKEQIDTETEKPTAAIEKDETKIASPTKEEEISASPVESVVEAAQAKDTSKSPSPELKEKISASPIPEKETVTDSKRASLVVDSEIKDELPKPSDKETEKVDDEKHEIESKSPSPVEDEKISESRKESIVDKIAGDEIERKTASPIDDKEPIEQPKSASPDIGSPVRKDSVAAENQAKPSTIDLETSPYKEVYDYSHPFDPQFQQELRETHITTVESPIVEKSKLIDLQVIDKTITGSLEADGLILNDIKEEDEDRISPPSDELQQLSAKESTPLDVQTEPVRSVSPREQEVLKIVANVAEVLKSEKDITDIIPDFDAEALEKNILQRASTPDVHSTILDEQLKDIEAEGDLKAFIDTHDLSASLSDAKISIDEKEQHEIAEKHQITLLQDISDSSDPHRKESCVSDVLDDSRRESAFSTFSEKDFTKDESTMDRFSRPNSSLELKHDEFEHVEKLHLEESSDSTESRKASIVSEKEGNISPEKETSASPEKIDDRKQSIVEAPGQDQKETESKSTEKDDIKKTPIEESSVEKTFERAESVSSKLEEDGATVQRMLVTASSEDGGEEIEICAEGTIKFSPAAVTPEVMSGKVTPEIGHDDLKKKAELVKETIESAHFESTLDVEDLQRRESSTSRQSDRPDSVMSHFSDTTEPELKETCSSPEKQIHEKLSDSSGKSTGPPSAASSSHGSADIECTKTPSGQKDEHTIHKIDEAEEDKTALKSESCPESATSGKSTPLAVESEKKDSSRSESRESGDKADGKSPALSSKDEQTEELLTQKSRSQSIISEKQDTPEKVADATRPESSVSGKEIDVKATPSPTIKDDKKDSLEKVDDAKSTGDSSRPESSAQDDKKSPTLSAGVEQKDTPKPESRSQSAASAISEKEDIISGKVTPIDAGRPESSASDKKIDDSATKSPIPPIESGKKDSLIDGKIITKDESSRPESAVSDVSVKATCEKQIDEKASKSPSPTIDSGKKDSLDKVDDKASVKSETSRPESSASDKQTEIESTKSPIPPVESAKKDSVDKVDDKASVKSETSRPESAASDKQTEIESTKSPSPPVESAKKDSVDKIDDKLSVKSETSRPESAASDKQIEVESTKSPIPPVETAKKDSLDKVDDKISVKSEASRPESAASEKQIEVESTKSVESIEKDSLEKIDDKVSVKSETSRPESAASDKQIDEKASKSPSPTIDSGKKDSLDKVDDKVSVKSETSRPESAASDKQTEVESTKSPIPPVESVKKDSLDKIDDKLSVKSETSRPVSAASDVSTKDDHKSPAPPVKEEQPTLKSESRSQSVASAVSIEEKIEASIEQKSRSQSIVSEKQEIVSGKATPIETSRPESSASDKKVDAPTESSRPESRVSDDKNEHVSPSPSPSVKDKQPNGKIPSEIIAYAQKLRSESIASEKQADLSGKTTPALIESRPESAASHGSAVKDEPSKSPAGSIEQKSHSPSLKDEKIEISSTKIESRSSSIVSTTVEQKEIEKSSRPESQASDEQVEHTPQIVEEEQIIEKVTEETLNSRSQSIVSEKQEMVSGKATPIELSRPESSASDKKSDEHIEPSHSIQSGKKDSIEKIDDKASVKSESSRPESVASDKQIEIESTKSPIPPVESAKKASLDTTDDKVSVKSETSRPESAASDKQIDEKASKSPSPTIDSGKKDSLDKFDDKASVKSETSRPESAASDKQTEIESTKSPSPPVESAKIDSVDKIDDKLSVKSETSRPESAASDKQIEVESTKSPIPPVETTKKDSLDKIDDKLSMKSETSRPASAASDVSTKDDHKSPAQPVKEEQSTLKSESRSQSVASAVSIEEKLTTEQKSRSQSIVSEKQDISGKATPIETSRPESSASDKKEDITKSPTPSIEKPDEKTELKSQSPLLKEDSLSKTAEPQTQAKTSEKPIGAETSDDKLEDSKEEKQSTDTDVDALQIATGSTMHGVHDSAAAQKTTSTGNVDDDDDDNIRHDLPSQKPGVATIMKESRSKSVASISVFGLGAKSPQAVGLENISEVSKDDSILLSSSRKASDISTLIDDVKKIDEKIASKPSASEKIEQTATTTIVKEENLVSGSDHKLSQQKSAHSSLESTTSDKGSIETVLESGGVLGSFGSKDQSFDLPSALKDATSTTTVTTTQSIVSKGVSTIKSETKTYRDSDNESLPISDDEAASSQKYSYEDYQFERSNSELSRKSDLDIDDSQNDIPPQYGSQEFKSAVTVSSSYAMDPMSASFYGELPSGIEKSEPVTTISTVRTIVTKQYESHHPDGAGDSSTIIVTEKLKTKPGDHKFLDEADLDFEKALEEHRQVRGSDVMSSITSKYEFSPSKISPEQLGEASASFPLTDVKTPKEQAVKEEVTTTAAAVAASASASAEAIARQLEDDLKKAEERVASWGKPLGLPVSMNENPPTPKKERRIASAKIKTNNEKNIQKRANSPNKNKKITPIYMDLTYVPHNGNSYYSHVEFFKRVRARYYVFSGTEPSRDVYNALLEAKQTWEDKNLEVTIIPTYDTDVLGYWVAENEEMLAKYHIDLSPSASRCTINLQDHETSCSAYRLEF